MPPTDYDRLERAAKRLKGRLMDTSTLLAQLKEETRGAVANQEQLVRLEKEMIQLKKAAKPAPVDNSQHELEKRRLLDKIKKLEKKAT